MRLFWIMKMSGNGDNMSMGQMNLAIATYISPRKVSNDFILIFKISFGLYKRQDSLQPKIK